MNIWARIALAVLLMALLAGSVASLAAWHFVDSPMDASTNATRLFAIETGESLRSISIRLEEEKLVRWGEGLRLYARLTKLSLQAGEFELSPSMSPRRILDILAFGHPILHRLHFPEGLTMGEVALAVNATGLTTAERFLDACRNKEYLLSQGLNATSAEGYLFPETYYFPRIAGQDPYPILKALLEGFKRSTAALPQATNSSEMHRVVILASLVEKETSISAERGIVAGVYAKRMTLGMLLQCDPTVIYGLGPAFDGNLKRSHLEDPGNTYNTYVHPGLPPGPICSPGKAALQAASSPDVHDFLYFVARPDGSHHFSRSLAEHNNAVIKYQRRGKPFPSTKSSGAERG